MLTLSETFIMVSISLSILLGVIFRYEVLDRDEYIITYSYKDFYCNKKVDYIDYCIATDTLTITTKFSVFDEDWHPKIVKCNLLSVSILKNKELYFNRNY